MSTISQYIINNINVLPIEERYTVSKFLNFRDVPLKQTNKGVYTFIEILMKIPQMKCIYFKRLS